ncbi:hypothetical protein BJX99DRAFT_217407 [Aspergillus californicus]
MTRIEVNPRCGIQGIVLLQLAEKVRVIHSSTFPIFFSLLLMFLLFDFIACFT